MVDRVGPGLSTASVTVYTPKRVFVRFHFTPNYTIRRRVSRRETNWRITRCWGRERARKLLSDEYRIGYTCIFIYYITKYIYISIYLYTYSRLPKALGKNIYKMLNMWYAPIHNFYIHKFLFIFWGFILRIYIVGMWIKKYEWK